MRVSAERCGVRCYETSLRKEVAMSAPSSAFTHSDLRVAAG